MTARAMGDALSIPVTGVCTLDVIAASVTVGSHFWSPRTPAVARCTGPRMTRMASRSDGPHVERAADIEWPGAAYGAGALMYRDAFVDAREPEYPDAGVLASMVANGRAVVLPPDPLYLRRPDAVEPSPRRPADCC